MGLQLTSEQLAVALAGVCLAVTAAYVSATSPLLALGALAATLLALLVLLNAEAVLLCFVMVLPWSELLEWPSETVSIIKLSGLVLVFAYTLRLVQGREPIEHPSTLLPAALFVLFSGLSLLVAAEADIAGLTKWLTYVQFVAFFFIFIQLVRTRESIVRVMRAIVLSGSLAALWGFAAFVQGDIDRAAGPISDPNDFGFLLAVLFPLAVFLAIRDRPWRPVWIASTLMLAAAILATLSRGAIVAFLVLALWALAFRKVPISLAAAVTVGVAGAVAIALFLWSPLIEQRIAQKGRIASANVASREVLWQAGVEMAADSPALGVGPGQFGPESKSYIRDQPVALENPVAHSAYVEIGAEAGLPALVAFGFFLGGSFVLATRSGRLSRRQGDREGSALATTAQSSLLLAIVGGMFISAQVAVPLYLAAALAAATYKAARDRADEGSALVRSAH